MYQVQKALDDLPEDVKTRCSYRQVDICNIQAVKFAFADVNHKQGVKHIIHAASVVADSPIDSFSIAAYEQILRPKVLGSWNLHVVSQELGLHLDSFVLLSSVK